jgi:hypothetical protein
MEVSGQLLVPVALPPGEIPPCSHCIGDWVGPRVGLYFGEQKILPLLGIGPRLTSPWPVTMQTELGVSKHRNHEFYFSDLRQ